MTTLTVIAALVVLLIIFIGATVELGKREKNFKGQIKDLEDQLRDKDKSISYLVKHAQELANIQRTENELKNRIEEAKTDEEIADIVDNIINVNNSFVQNDADGGE